MPTKLHRPIQSCVTPWENTGLSSVRNPQGIRSGNTLQPWSQLKLLFYCSSVSLHHALTPELTWGTAQEARRFGELLEGTLGLQSKSIHRGNSATRGSNERERAKLGLCVFRCGFNPYLSLKGDWLFLCESGRLVCNFRGRQGGLWGEQKGYRNC